MKYTKEQLIEVFDVLPGAHIAYRTGGAGMTCVAISQGFWRLTGLDTLSSEETADLLTLILPRKLFVIRFMMKYTERTVQYLKCYFEWCMSKMDLFGFI